MAETLLEGRAARSLPFGGGCAVLLGGVFAALAVVFILAFGLAFLVAGRELPREALFMGPPGILFVLIVGVGLIWTGRRDWRRAARAEEQAALHPGEPWYADWAWDPAGADAESPGGMSLFVMLFILLVIAPFNFLWLVVFDPKQELAMRLFALMVLIADLFLYMLLKAIVDAVRDRIRFGRPRLHFETFPFSSGRALRARVTAKVFAGQEGVLASLRCIDERMASVPDASRTSTDTVQVFQVYEAHRLLESPFRGENVPVSFVLPEDAPSTELLRKPPRYWELEIKGAGDDAITFLVPVYAGAR